MVLCKWLATIYDSGIDFYQQRCALAIVGSEDMAAGIPS
jgi:hypothetical protein